MVVKFAEHFMWIAIAVYQNGGDGDRCGTRRTASSTTSCALPDGTAGRLKVRSLVGPLADGAVMTFDHHFLEQRAAGARTHFGGGCNISRKSCNIAADVDRPGVGDSRILALVDEESCARCSRGCSTRTSSSGPYGIRSISRYHRDHPYVLDVNGTRVQGRVLAGESDTGCSAATRTGAARCGCRST